MIGAWTGHRRPNRHRGQGYACRHTALDDHSRLAYSGLLADERKDTAAAFWTHAAAYFASCTKPVP